MYTIAFNEGYQAYAEGMSGPLHMQRQCPYNKNTIRYFGWIDGCAQAKLELGERSIQNGKHNSEATNNQA
jgi:ribosome modulation factor